MSQPLYQPADQLILSAGRGALEPDAGALGNGQRRRHRRALHEYEVVAVGEPLHGDAFRLVSDRHPKELANGDRDVQAGERPSSLVVVLVGSVVLGLDLEAPREGRGELPVDFEVIEAEDSLVRQVPDLRDALGVLNEERAVRHRRDVELEVDPGGRELVPGLLRARPAPAHGARRRPAAARTRLGRVRRSSTHRLWIRRLSRQILQLLRVARGGVADGRPLPWNDTSASRISRFPPCFRSAASSTSIARPVCPTESRAIAQT